MSVYARIVRTMSEDKYSRLQYCTCFNMRRANRLITQLYDHALKPVGIKITQFSILAVLANTDEITVSRLSSILGMERTTLTRSLVRLEKEKLVTSHEGEDARERWVHLTKRGYAMLDTAIPYWEKAQGIMREGFGEDFSDLLQMLKTSEKLAVR